MNTEKEISNSGRTPCEAEGHTATPPMPRGRPGPTRGDVLVSRRTACADVFAISVLPADALVISMRYQDALKEVCELARGLAVDGWYTCDHTHFVRVAEYRSETR